MDNNKKGELLGVLAANCWELRCINDRCGDDGGYHWEVVGRYMANPRARVLGVSYDEDEPELAIVDAIKTTKSSIYNYLYAFSG